MIHLILSEAFTSRVWCESNATKSIHLKISIWLVLFIYYFFYHKASFKPKQYFKGNSNTIAEANQNFVPNIQQHLDGIPSWTLKDNKTIRFIYFIYQLCSIILNIWDIHLNILALMIIIRILNRLNYKFEVCKNIRSQICMLKVLNFFS